MTSSNSSLPAFIAPLPIGVRPPTSSSARRRSSSPSFPRPVRTTCATLSEAQLEQVKARLLPHVQTIFTTPSPDYTLYSPDVIFEDPLTSFQGTSRYAANISFLSQSPVFTDASLIVHHTALDPLHDTIRTRWTLSMTVAFLPWRPVVTFTGQSDYVISESTQLVIKHIDYWDSLSNSAYFSPDALKDLVIQCSPATTTMLPWTNGPTVTTLRRTHLYTIYKFEQRCCLVPVSAPYQLYEPTRPDSRSSDAIDPCFVAVGKVSRKMPSQSEIDEQVDLLHRAMDTASYVTKSSPSFSHVCVRVRRGSSFLYAVWIPLEDVRSTVDSEE